ncbi:diadenylate cyclase CdaA [Heyndrickxia ginsengihumi]|uniref:Diadenylate cyclase n=1 Tax=Heyndrickxia ginsengihumi TaxID=363870 RepID=A0A0A6VA35_9BACI|nr:diadenylate cyclase CdaA [Heyndrickxia ginsengihumi]KHD85080.1 membrane protein [Heyndrickxia ginsengihumi]MBE6185588.1 TIGR00159 family protein [Bacillus sp. (in: firmicutes)]MCM3022749.1 diadenylate cyclase CdaA [Heyndrickxia ginsengihumi]NEY21716.1 TIGR00159 family protein [Heyndrickxia ginsengihumi]
MHIADFPIFSYLSNIVDILVVWFVIYKVLMIIRGTKAVQLVEGIFVIIIIRFLSSLLGLQTLEFIMEQVFTYGFLAIIIIFQPELRRALEQLGRGKFFSRAANHEDDEQIQLIDSIVSATSYMAKRRIGALISIERETGLGDYVETGIQLDSAISSQLLINIFIPNTPLHDGAVIIQKGKVAAAACYLPLSESPFISKELGTRHRAAVGISEVTDSLTVVVSEETGGITITKNGELHRDLTLEQLQEALKIELKIAQKAKEPSSLKWNWRGKKNG